MLHLCPNVCMGLVVVAVPRGVFSKSSFSLVRWWHRRAATEFANLTEQNQLSLIAQTRCLYETVSSHSLCSIHVCFHVSMVEFPCFLFLSTQLSLHHSIHQLYDDNYILQPRIFIWTWQIRLALQKNRLWSEHSTELSLLLQTNPILIYFECQITIRAEITMYQNCTSRPPHHI